MRQTPDILAEEAMRSLGESGRTRVFVDGLEHRLLIEEIARLARRAFASPRDEFVEIRKAAASQAREEMRNDFGASPEVKSRLKEISIDRLKDWLTEEARSERGVGFLAGQLAGVLSAEPFPKLLRIAESLLASDEYRLSHALVRNGWPIGSLCPPVPSTTPTMW